MDRITMLEDQVRRLQKYIEGQNGLLRAYRGVRGPSEKTFRLLESLKPGDLDPPSPRDMSGYTEEDYDRGHDNQP